jgi:hypothetical protein
MQLWPSDTLLTQPTTRTNTERKLCVPEGKQPGETPPQCYKRHHLTRAIFKSRKESIFDILIYQAAEKKRGRGEQQQ